MTGIRTLDPAYRAVTETLAAFTEADPAYSAQVTIKVGGRTVVDAWTGPALGEHSAICVFSVSKGLTGLCIGALVERGMLDLEHPLAHYWPEFGAHGKDRITVGEALSHRAGVPFPPPGVTASLDDRVIAEAVADAHPIWEPGSAFGYHALTVGSIASELVRRITGQDVPAFFESEVRAPRGLEAWFRVPDEVEPRVAPVRLPAFPTAASPAPTLADAVAYDLIGAEPDGFAGFETIANTRAGHTAGLAAASAVASARGLAGAYAAALWDGVDDGAGDGSGSASAPRLFGDETQRLLTRIRSDGTDITSGNVLRFGTLFMIPWLQRPFASWRAFGHDGAADALAFADPESDLVFGYTTDRPWAGEEPRRPDALARAALAVARG